MKKTYQKPLLEETLVYTEEMLSSSSLTGNGDVNTGIIPGDDIFDGVFNAGEESSHNIWNAD